MIESQSRSLTIRILLSRFAAGLPISEFLLDCLFRIAYVRKVNHAARDTTPRGIRDTASSARAERTPCVQLQPARALVRIAQRTRVRIQRTPAMQQESEYARPSEHLSVKQMRELVHEQQASTDASKADSKNEARCFIQVARLSASSFSAKTSGNARLSWAGRHWRGRGQVAGQVPALFARQGRGQARWRER